MAERFHIELPSGLTSVRQLAWADAQGDSSNRLGSLEWSAVVLPPDGAAGSELTVDLTVSAVLSPQSPGEVPELVNLQKMSRGKTFQGIFEPTKDSRLAPKPGGNGLRAEVDSVLFEFDNSFSWFTDKEIELVVLRVRPPGLPLARVPPLPPSRPPPPLPRVGRGANNAVPEAAEAAGTVEVTAAVDGAPVASFPELRLPALPAINRCEVQRFAAHLDAWLAAAECMRPCDGLPGADDAWLQELLVGVSTLRDLCRQTQQDAELGGGGPGAGAAAVRAAESAGLASAAA